MKTGWAQVALGEICEFRYGRALKAEDRSGTGSPVYGSNGRVGAHDFALTAGPTIVIGRKGSYGQVQYSDEPVWPIDTTYFVDKTCTSCDLKWLAYRLASLGLTNLNRAAAVPGLNREDAYRLRLLLPPLAEQQRIARILDLGESLQAKRRRSLATVDKLRSAHFVRTFGSVVANDRDWRLDPLGSLAVKFSDGPFGSNLKSADYVESGVRVIRLQNIGIGEFDGSDEAFISEEHFSTIAKHECRPGDVLIGTLGDPNIRACVLPEAVVRAVNKADCVQMRVDPSRASREFVVGLLNDPELVNRALALSTGQTRTRVSMGRLRDLPVPVPPLSLQKRFAETSRTLDRIKGSLQRWQRDSDELFASLQRRAFTGTV